MIEIGKIQKLEIARITNIGAYLAAPGTENEKADRAAGEVLLPNNEFKTVENPRKLNKGELLDAFIYLDSEDRPIATLKTPKLTLGGLSILKCKDVNNVGAFLDWGLPKDLFLPYKEQTSKVKPGDEVLVTLYTDKSNRLAASMKVFRLLRQDSPYKKDDNVNGFVYELSRDFGAFVAVDDIFTAMIPKKELMRDLKVGERLSFRVTRVLDDGKLELSLREPGYLQLFTDCEVIMNELTASKKGFLPYHDKSETLVIIAKFNMSKNSFKRAIGHLYKEGKIEILENGIRLK